MNLNKPTAIFDCSSWNALIFTLHICEFKLLFCDLIKKNEENGNGGEQIIDMQFLTMNRTYSLMHGLLDPQPIWRNKERQPAGAALDKIDRIG